MATFITFSNTNTVSILTVSSVSTPIEIGQSIVDSLGNYYTIQSKMNNVVDTYICLLIFTASTS